jgi:hypothetical protein
MTRSADGRISAVMPEESPRGTGVAGVLTSPLYGLESQLDEFSLRVLKRIYDVALNDKSPNRSNRLNRLRQLVPSLVTAEGSPDPYKNIARDAYEVAMQRLVADDTPSDVKINAVEKLAEMLYQNAKGDVK